MVASNFEEFHMLQLQAKERRDEIVGNLEVLRRGWNTVGRV
jgi:hypothetical protein